MQIQPSQRKSADALKAKQKKFNFLAYLSMLILYALILAYAVLSQSIFSVCAVAALILSLFVNIARPAHLTNKNPEDKVFDWNKVVLYPLDKIIWVVFIVINSAFFILKVAIYYSGTADAWAQDLKEMLEVQGAAYVFIPLVLFPFAVGTLFLKEKPKMLKDYGKKINPYIALPLYLMLGALIILNQIFSVSVAGLVYFFLAIYLFWMRSYNFKDPQFKVLLYLVQIMASIMITANCLATITIFQSSNAVSMFKLFGIYSIQNFGSSLLDRAHIICEVLLALLGAYINRLLIYQSFNSLIKQESSDFNEFVGLKDGKDGKESEKDLIEQQGVYVPVNRTQSDVERDATDKVNRPRKQIEMRDMSERLSNPAFKSQHIQRQTIENVQDRIIFEEVIKHQKQQVDEQQLPKKKNIIIQTGLKLNELKKQLLEVVHVVFNFFNSPEFSLRVIEILSIIVIQRFNNIYSFVALLWLAMVSTVENHKLVMIITGCVMLPMELVNYVIAYFYNMDPSPAADMQGKEIFGFQKYSSIWLDVIIFNAYFNYIILYLKSYEKLKVRNFRTKKQFAGKPKVWELILAFVYRYSYMLTLVGMFFLGFSSPTLMNIILVALFLIFFSNGDTLIITTRQRNGRQKSTLTTFSKKYWFVIVYFTLLCILAKYIYLLFFTKNQDLQTLLQPTGINEIYAWSFNFSLSSDCPSNTTPWFIIFVLAEIQIIISRTYIYTALSFSIMSYISQDTLVQPETTLEKGKRQIISFLVGISELYYQSLYYVSGIIILACSYRWCFISLAIIVLTVMGLLVHFSKRLIGIVLILNLIFLFGNYLIILINKYQVITTWLGQDFINVINYISLLIGFQTESGSYARIFVLNVVNFYFIVLCYYLSNILDTPVSSSARESISEQVQSNLDSSRIPHFLKDSLNVEEGNQSRFARSVIDSEFDTHFAENYKKGVIGDIQTYYNADLVRKYAWIRKIGTFLVYFGTDMVSIFVIISCLYFRVALSMLIFLFLYMIFYFTLFDQLGTLFRSSGYYDQIETQLRVFRAKQNLLEEQADFKSLIDDRDVLLRAELEMRLTEENSRLLKNQFKQKIWKYSAILSGGCLILTYASQFINSDFYSQKISFEYTTQLEKILFLAGINVNPGQGVGLFIYFYYVMVIITVIEKLVLQFVQRMGLIEADAKENVARKSIKDLKGLENTEQLINCHVSENFIEETKIFEEMEAGAPHEMGLADVLMSGLLGQNYCEQANVLIYFQYGYAQMKITLMYGLLTFMIRLYLWLMLINVYAKSNVFSFFYFIAVVYFWFKPVEFDLIRNINKAAIVIICLQYAVLLMDLNTIVSPLPLPYNDNTLSLLEYLIEDPSLVNFIAVSSQSKGSNSGFVVSFIVNSIIIFLTELCFTIFTVLSERMMKTIFAVYLKYEFILQKLRDIRDRDPVILSYNNYKHLSYRVLNFIYERIIMSSYLFVALLIFILLAGVQGYLAVLLLVVAFLYIYLGVFSKWSGGEEIVTYTKHFFRFFNALQFLCLLLTSVLNIPMVQDNEIISNIADQVGALTSLEQIFLMLFIQLWLDLHSSQQFARMTGLYRAHSLNREKVLLKSLAFQRNNMFISSLIHQYKEVLSFDLSIAAAIAAVKQWHSSTSKKLELVEYDFPGMRPGKYNELIQKEIEEERISDDHKEFSSILGNYVRSYTDVPLLHNYIEMMRYIVARVEAVIFNGDIELSCWSFIREDYGFIQELIQAYEGRLREIVQALGEADADQPMGQTLLALHENFIGAEQSRMTVKIKLLTPSKLQIDIQPQPEHQHLSNYIFPFLMSNIDSLIILLTVIYYILNPCILSFPLVAFIFCYYTIATNKQVHLMTIYIFLLILATELMMLVQPDSTVLGQGNTVKFLFDTDPDTGEVYYNQGYLYFFFVMIFLSQEVVRYKGNRYRTELEAQNLEQAFLRVLMNEGIDSKLNIWKFSRTDMETGEQYNPFGIATLELSNNVDKLESTESSFLDVFSDRKIGVDLYPVICAIQILLMVYMIFFYALMAYVQGFSIEDATKYFQFSGDMVIGVLVHVFVMILERYLAIALIPRRRKLILKYALTMAIFAAFSFFIYYQAPIQSFISWIYSPSPALIGFSFFYFFYFYLSALQVKYGYKEFKSLNSLMTRRGFVNYYAVTIYTAIPFLYELKIIIDWTFSHTSLTLFDWFKQFSIYLRAFRAKIQYYNAIDNPLGEVQPWFAKIIGWAGFIIIILIIFGPMILFSNLNPISQANLVISGEMSLALQAKNGNSFTLYSTSHFSTPPHNFTQAEFDDEGFSNVPTLQQMAQGQISSQFQSVTYQPYSDNNWGIARPNYQALLSQLNTTIQQLIQTNKSTVSFQLAINYQFKRQIIQTISSSSMFVYPNDGSDLSLSMLQDVYRALTTCNSSVILPQFYTQLIRLSTIGTTYKPRPINYTNGTYANGTNQYPYVVPVVLSLFCTGDTPVINTNEVFWGLSLNDATENTGVLFYVFCDKYQNVIAGYGFTALYTSIILVVAGFIRSLFDGNMPYIPYEMNPKSDNILQMCEAISTLRIRKQYREEYLMYYELIDLIRSPEIMKYMSGSYPFLIEQAFEKEEREKRLKEMEKNKKE